VLNQRNSGLPEKKPSAASVEGEHASLNQSLVFSLALAYRGLVGDLMFCNISGLIDMLRQFEELTWIRESTSREHGDLTEIYTRLDKVCSQTEELFEGLSRVTSYTQLLAAMERGAHSASALIEIVDSAEGLCTRIIEKMFGAAEAVVVALRDENDEREEFDYESEQDHDSEEVPTAESISVERDLSIRLCEQDASEIRLALRALVSKSADEPQTLTDLVGGWSSSGLYLAEALDGEVPSITVRDAAIAVAVVHSAINTTLENLLYKPQFKTEELVDFLGENDEDLSESKYRQVLTLFQTPIPCSVSAESGGQIIYTFSLPEDCLSMASDVVSRLSATLADKRDLFAHLGVNASIKCQATDNRVGISCCLNVPVLTDVRRVVSSDTRRVMLRDAELRAQIPDTERFVCSVIDEPGKQAISIKLPFAILTSTEGRSRMCGLLPATINLAREIGACEISIAHLQRQNDQVPASFDLEDFAFLIAGSTENDPSEAAYLFDAVKRHVKRWIAMPGLADVFEEPERDVVPWLIVPVDFMSNRGVVREIARFGKEAELSFLNVAGMGKDVDGVEGLLTRCRTALNLVRPIVLGESSLVVSVKLVDSIVSPEQKLRYFVYDQSNSLVAMVRLGLDTESEEILGFPWRAMKSLNEAIAATLADLWRSRLVTVSEFQCRLAEMGFEVSDQIAGRYVGKQLHREAPIALSEVGFIMGAMLQESTDDWIIRQDLHGRALLVLLKWEWLHRFGALPKRP